MEYEKRGKKNVKNNEVPQTSGITSTLPTVKKVDSK